MKEVFGSFQRIRQPRSYFKLFPYSQRGRHSGQVSLFLIGRLFSYILPDATRKGCVSSWYLPKSDSGNLNWHKSLDKEYK